MGFFDRFLVRKKHDGTPENDSSEYQEIGLHCFPDDEDAKWNIDSIGWDGIVMFSVRMLDYEFGSTRPQ